MVGPRRAGLRKRFISELVAARSRTQRTWENLNRSLVGCHTSTLELGASQVQAAIHAVTRPPFGRSSSVYSWEFTYAGIRLGFDLILLRAGTYDGCLSYADLGIPPRVTVTAFAHAVRGREAGERNRLLPCPALSRSCARPIPATTRLCRYRGPCSTALRAATRDR